MLMVKKWISNEQSNQLPALSSSLPLLQIIQQPRKKKSGVGVMMQADINWAFASFMGLGAGVYVNLNSVQSPIGFNIKLLVGKMGREKKHK